uniref:Uncharacterized protein n=1 Tax=Medicago truncatula TaxID=3880 RepID=A4PRJ5_MEDTR|nr:hypothetical protein MtrDRAFT_AC139526g55v2 [Medicago truncatula]
MEGEKMSESKNNDGREKIITQQGVFGSTFGLERIEDESCGGDGCETPKAGLCLQVIVFPFLSKMVKSTCERLEIFYTVITLFIMHKIY